jgi:hypothetical protein
MRSTQQQLGTWEPSRHFLEGRGKPRKPCVEMAGRRAFRMHIDLSRRSNVQEMQLPRQEQQRAATTETTRFIPNNRCLLREYYETRKYTFWEKLRILYFWSRWYIY